MRGLAGGLCQCEPAVQRAEEGGGGLSPPMARRGGGHNRIYECDQVIARTEANLPAAGTDTPQFCFYLKAPVERACHVDLLSACLLLSCLVPASSSVRLDGCQSGRTHRIRRALAGSCFCGGGPTRGAQPCRGGGRGRGGPLVPGGAPTTFHKFPLETVCKFRGRTDRKICHQAGSAAGRR